MLADSSFPSPFGSLAPDLHLPGTAKHQLFTFIANELPCWRDRPDRPPATAETELTSLLCAHLNDAARFSDGWSRIQFLPEEPDEIRKGRKIDLSPKPLGTTIVIEGRRHTLFDKLFPVECKRLPMPDPSNAKRDEWEYVVNRNGSTGGIQRFKEANHGADHSFAGMIGFIQDESDGPAWLAHVNGWITELCKEDNSTWSETEQLTVISHTKRQKLLCCQSNHDRPSLGSKIEINHAWIEMN